MDEGTAVISDDKTGTDVGLPGSTRVDVEIASWRDRVVVTEAAGGEESGVGHGRDDQHAASVRHKQTKLNRLAKSYLIITEPFRNGSTFSIRTAFPQTAGQHLPRQVNTSGAIVAWALPQLDSTRATSLKKL